MFHLFKDRTHTFRLLFISASFLALRYAQRFNPTTPIGTTITSIVLRIFKFFITYQLIITMAGLAFELAQANAAAFFNTITEFVKFLNNGDQVKISMFFHFLTAMTMPIMMCIYIIGHPNESLMELLSPVLLFIGFIHVERNFEGPRRYMSIFVLMVFLTLFVYSKS